MTESRSRARSLWLAAPALALTLASCEQTPQPLTPEVGGSANSTASQVPGTLPKTAGPSLAIAAAAAETGLQPAYSATGRISLSLDALGTTATSGLVQVEKPVGATVRKAFLAAATTPFFRALAPNEIQIDGAAIPGWTSTYNNTTSFGSFFNHWADVTTLVKTKLDSAPAGTVNMTINEVQSGGTDGTILAVIFDDPNVTRDHSVVLLFGGQQLAGDQFFVTLASPVDKTDPNLLLNMSLGISFGYQPSGQYSIVDVNGQRLSTSAGGQDDGQDSNGALITVGGIGDSNSNPSPFVTDGSGKRTDDELYDLRPFVSHGDNLIRVDTRNPSNDDNILFAAFYTTVAARVDIPEPVAVDLRPGDGSNTIVLFPTGPSLIQVAMLGRPNFDVRTVDPASATLGNEDGRDTPIARNRTRTGTTPAFRHTDINADGIIDLVMWFERSAMINNGDLTPSTTRLVLLANINPTGKARGEITVNVVN